MVYDVLIIGSGAAGYGAADYLFKMGIKNIAVITDGRCNGTSRNTGSDKQTYYKLSLDGLTPDCAYSMAADIFSGGACDGELAYTEAANSARCFYRLVEYGVNFPYDKYGAYAGYQTDHDSSSRATSVGPLTSRQMTERLENKVMFENKTPIIDNCIVTKIITDNNTARGVIAYDTQGGELRKILCGAVIAATGAPADIYAQSVYPPSQRGMTGTLIAAGAELVNFAEWQYGLASTKFRWNVSGSYLQVLPRMFSIDKLGNEKEFLPDYLKNDVYEMLFLKGYQWPFDCEKAKNGSSQVDLAVQNEIDADRRVFLDFTKNGLSFCFDHLCDTAKEYLTKSNANLHTPVERLAALNPKAIKLFKDNGIDLYREPLEIAVCAQHNNGGVLVDTNYQSTVQSLFVIGEAAGVFGIKRPGGAALNSTQVGGLRAARFIAQNKPVMPAPNSYENELTAAKMELSQIKHSDIAISFVDEIKREMSLYAAFRRDGGKLPKLLEKTERALKINYETVQNAEDFYRNKNTLISTICLIKSILQTMPYCGSRGGALFLKQNKVLPENKSYRIKRSVFDGEQTRFVDITPLPQHKVWFENLPAFKNSEDNI